MQRAGVPVVPGYHEKGQELDRCEVQAGRQTISPTALLIHQVDVMGSCITAWSTVTLHDSSLAASAATMGTEAFLIRAATCLVSHPGRPLCVQVLAASAAAAPLHCQLEAALATPGSSFFGVGCGSCAGHALSNAGGRPGGFQDQVHPACTTFFGFCPSVWRQATLCRRSLQAHV
jgi:hypothetical protein